MDGPTSRLPSSSVASVTTAHLTTRRSMKETFNSAPVTPNANTYMDPPRPAREGHEWVWFPAGYWAEREIVESPGKVMKHFKWRKRSGKSSSGKETTQDDLDHFPNNFWDHTPRTPYPLPSPFLTEEAHVQWLQKSPYNRQGTSSESGGSSFPLNRTDQMAQPSPYLSEETHVLSLQRSPLANNSSESGASISKSTRLTPSSPLTTGKGDSDSATPHATPVSQPLSTPSGSLSSLLRLSPTSQESKSKKSFLARLLTDHNKLVCFIFYAQNTHWLPIIISRINYMYTPTSLTHTQQSRRSKKPKATTTYASTRPARSTTRARGPS